MSRLSVDLSQHQHQGCYLNFTNKYFEILAKGL